MYYVQQLVESRSLPLLVNRFFGIYITKMKYLIKRILSTCPWKKTNQNLASHIIFKLFHIYSLLGIINENGFARNIFVSKKGNVGAVETNSGGNFCVLCRKIIELGVYFIYKFYVFQFFHVRQQLIWFSYFVGGLLPLYEPPMCILYILGGCFPSFIRVTMAILLHQDPGICVKLMMVNLFCTFDSDMPLYFHSC